MLCSMNLFYGDNNVIMAVCFSWQLDRQLVDYAILVGFRRTTRRKNQEDEEKEKPCHVRLETFTIQS